ncbi:MAG TPA: DUF456 domain-containing protein, partial [Gemmatimonadaceae bacterium]
LALLIAVLCISLFLIPLGLPGTWIMVAAAVGYSFLVPNSIGLGAIGGVLAIALVAEGLEFTLARKYTKKFGGSSRSGWGAILGGLVGVFVGVPIPVIGSIVGGFVGAFLGALVAEYTRGSGVEASARAATGAVVGRAVAAAMKVALGVVIAVWVVAAAIG